MPGMEEAVAWGMSCTEGRTGFHFVIVITTIATFTPMVKFMHVPSDLGLDIFICSHYDEEAKVWQLIGLTLQAEEPPSLNTRYEKIDSLPEGVMAIAYLFNSQVEGQLFLSGILAAGEKLDGILGGFCNLGCAAILKPIEDPELFKAQVGEEFTSNLAVIDFRHEEDDGHEDPVKDTVLSVHHKDHSDYGGKVKAPSKFALRIGDMRDASGRAFMMIYNEQDGSGEAALTSVVSADFLPGTRKPVSSIFVHHGSESQELFRLFAQQQDDFVLIPSRGVMFSPYLLPSGNLGFRVSAGEQS